MPTTIAVTGRAEERIDPELGAVTLSVGAQGATRDEVFTRTTVAHERLLNEVRGLEASGALDTWSAGQLRVWSYRPWNSEGRQLPLVHQASAEVEVIFKDLARLGDWLGEAAGVPELSVNGVDWRLTDATRRTVQEAAQRGAVADALTKARIYASALGLGVPTPIELADHGLLSVQPLPGGAPKMLMMRTAAEVGGGGTPTAEFAPAQLVIEASVDARFTAEAA
ncbi:SIMPL domain-containing protein [Agromyces sp. Marseille-P2726]|uniref:SIMPL domain-containing protein n=1 Tax=Agromyces sp. Marseille-P2726 TaxID=2709132 RepID=UPI00156E4A1B|nr:SIMPL domain-containing protein [Agromyces sp. Marseille-P2726]